ncbi:MAG: DUF72 domain-containing protein [Candidatus Dormibacteraeota bacterium]|nr:DUF72 domain-containing protein [Candidatus Dormibacteraeota bacterium]
MRLLAGTSGWQYADWRDRFYPPDVPQRRWLEHYARQFAVVEVNSTFYNLPSEQTVRRWAEATPDDFSFVVKASRYLTHVRRLRDPAQPVELLLERCHPLGARLACILLQLPPTMRSDAAALDLALRAFNGRVALAVEFRDRSWFNQDVETVLRDHHAALCIADRGGEQAEPDWHTSSFAYVRFHAGDGRPSPCYDPRTITAWAQRIAGWSCDTVYAFFNNDTNCCAPRDAARLAATCSAKGLTVSRAPRPEGMPSS